MALDGFQCSVLLNMVTTLVLHKIREIFWLGVQILGSQEGLYSVESGRYRTSQYDAVFIGTYKEADKSLARPGRKQANVSVRMAWISFGALPYKKKKSWQLASQCCWNRARPWHASELVSSLVGLRTYQHPTSYRCFGGTCWLTFQYTNIVEYLPSWRWR